MPSGGQVDGREVWESTFRLFHWGAGQISGSQDDALEGDDIALPVGEQMAVERFPDLDAADLEKISDWFGGRDLI